MNDKLRAAAERILEAARNTDHPFSVNVESDDAMLVGRAALNLAEAETVVTWCSTHGSPMNDHPEYGNPAGGVCTNYELIARRAQRAWEEAVSDSTQVNMEEGPVILSEPVSAVHQSDCSLHNAPAEPPGPCDCDARLHEVAQMLAKAQERLRALLPKDSSQDREWFLSEGKVEAYIKNLPRKEEPDHVRTLVAGNIRAFAGRLRREVENYKGECDVPGCMKAGGSCLCKQHWEEAMNSGGVSCGHHWHKDAKPAAGCAD